MRQISSLDIADEEFINTFERAGFERTNFPHRAHLRMAWLYVRHLGVQRATEKAAAGIRPWRTSTDNPPSITTR